MLAGILKKVRNSGELASITSQIVYEADDFDFYVDEDGEHLKHKPKIFGERGKAIGVYALAKTKDNAVYIETMTEDDVNKIKSVSKGKNGPWSGPFQFEMWKKSAIRRLSKRLPMSTDLESTIHADDDMYDLEDAHRPEPPRTEKNKPSRLKDAMGLQSGTREEEAKEVEVFDVEAKEVDQTVSEEEIPI